ncbi:MAG TPA: hypothetical protein PLH35_10690, partial [Proteiniphilum sp.]|nr:hypothetical protein [Proteiniphilum sp.]
MRKIALPFLLLLFIKTLTLTAQDADSTNYPSIQVDGTLKNKYEYASEKRELPVSEAYSYLFFS